MKSLPPGLQAHLDGGVTTLCWCWKLRRSDGLWLGFTDHDRNLVFDDVTFEAESGFTASEIVGAVGLNVDTLEADGVLSSRRLDEASLAAGQFDDAEIEIWRVNWAEVGQRALMRKGSLGEVRRGPTAFTAEVRGLAHYLNQERGRLYQFACDAELGDNRCGVDPDGPHRQAGVVVAMRAPWSFEASGLSGDAGLFDGGLLTWTTGGNAGRQFEVMLHRPAQGGGAVVELWRSVTPPPVVGDSFAVTVGCDKRFSTCRDRFGNSANFRGFPHIPGTEFT
jgi:uncharacterized phage protein (TIGR02218 family)